jgi:hypothetical protein
MRNLLPVAAALLWGCTAFHGAAPADSGTPLSDEVEESRSDAAEPTASETEPEPIAARESDEVAVDAEAAPPIDEPLYRLLIPGDGEPLAGVAPTRDMADDDPMRPPLEELLGTPYLEWVLELGAIAREIAIRHCVEVEAEADCRARLDHPALFVVMNGGNRPKQGLAIVGEQGTELLPETWYVEVDPRRAATLIPHEYGHAMMFTLLTAEPQEHPPGLPHTTGAITDDVTAFSEGWGIHFETLAGDRPELGPARARLHRDVFPVAGPIMQGDSLFEAKDLLNYAQSYRRHVAVKENRFACLPRVRPELAASGAPDAQDLLARWTDTTVDPARLRTLEQMVASEGLVAALFYRLATTGSPAASETVSGGRALPDPERYAAFFEAFTRITWKADAPSILEFLGRLIDGSTDDQERRRLARTALEVFHYVGFVEGAARSHAEAHAAGHRMDMAAFRTLLGPVSEARTAAVQSLAADPGTLAAVAGPELWLQLPDVLLGLPTFGIEPGPVFIDLNTAPEEFLMTLPGVGWAEADRIAAARLDHPFTSVEEAIIRLELDEQTATALRASPWSVEPDEAPTD